MDAVKFFKERDRMCDSFDDNCTGCELCKSSRSDLICRAYIFNYPEKAVAIVEQWAKDHPLKTRQSEFLKMFPKAKVDADNVVVVCPNEVCIQHNCVLKWGESTELKCRECRKQFWNEEVE